MFTTTAAADSLGGQLVGLANSITNTLLGKIADRVNLGFGAWLGLAASVFLAIRRLMRGVVVR